MIFDTFINFAQNNQDYCIQLCNYSSNSTPTEISCSTPTEISCTLGCSITTTFSAPLAAIALTSALALNELGCLTTDRNDPWPNALTTSSVIIPGGFS